MEHTKQSLVGKKVRVHKGKRSVVAKIIMLNAAYPKTAYTITWNKEDNPHEEFRGGADSWYSVCHCSQVTPL